MNMTIKEEREKRNEGLSIPIIGFNAIKNQKEKRNERM